MCENLPYESVYFKELHKEQERYLLGAAVVSTITSLILERDVIRLRDPTEDKRAF